jgi:MraZ protein
MRAGGGGERARARGRVGFFSTYEKQLDGKRRIVVPQEYRAQVTGPFDGVFCFPAISADCIEGGSQPLFDRYQTLIEELPFGDPLRDDLETTVFGGLVRLSFDTAGRITLPDSLCEEFGIETDVALVGLGDRFQIWALDRFRAQRAKARASAREGLAALRNAQRKGTA